MTYDSRPDTFIHSFRVGQLIVHRMASDLLQRAVSHDWTKTHSPEVEIFDEFTPKLKEMEYGTQEYKDCLVAMGDGLKHHYSHNRHHPEFHDDGINGMTLVDLMEMLADWKAATERMKNGDLAKSLEIQKERFGISDQLMGILTNTAQQYGWLDKMEDL